MKKQKWLMMGVTAVVCSALIAPGAFAKDKDDSYSVTNPTIFAPGPYSAQVVQATDAAKNTLQTGAAFTFPPTDFEKDDK